MARTLLDLTNEIVVNLGGRDDAVAVTAIHNCINAAIEAVMLTFDLPESRQLGRITFSIGVDELLIASTARLQDILKIRNETDGIDLGFIPIESLDWIVPTVTGTLVRFYSRDGDAIVVRPTPIKETICLVRYTTYPARLTEDASELPYEGHDSQTVALATSLAWCVFEESDSATMWNNALQVLMLPASQALKAREVIEGIPTLKELVSKYNTTTTSRSTA